MNRTPRSAARRKGMAVMITALMLGFVIPIVGLAIDAGVLYSIKAKLQSSVDAASMAAARSLSNGLTIAEQETSASNRAQAFFHANFPTNLLDTGAKNISVSVAETAFRTRTVTVNADVAAPVYFMRVMGFGTTTVRAIGKSSRRDVNVILVLDRSGSLETAGACDDVENASKAFVNLFANERDRLGLVTYGGSLPRRLRAQPRFQDRRRQPCLEAQRHPPQWMQRVDRIGSGALEGLPGDRHDQRARCAERDPVLHRRNPQRDYRRLEDQKADHQHLSNRAWSLLRLDQR